jgi:hypothetical protein
MADLREIKGYCSRVIGQATDVDTLWDDHEGQASDDLGRAQLVIRAGMQIELERIAGRVERMEIPIALAAELRANIDARIRSAIQGLEQFNIAEGTSARVTRLDAISVIPVPSGYPDPRDYIGSPYNPSGKPNYWMY